MEQGRGASPHKGLRVEKGERPPQPIISFAGARGGDVRASDVAVREGVGRGARRGDGGARRGSDLTGKERELGRKRREGGGGPVDKRAVLA